MFSFSATVTTASGASGAMAEPTPYNNEKDGRDSSSHVPEGHTSEVAFEDYLHHAALQRLEEEGPKPANSTLNWFYRLSEHKGKNVNVDVSQAKSIAMTDDEEERANASRALRLASWASVFYLITTDILGPFNAPYAISQVGWVPGEHDPLSAKTSDHLFHRNRSVLRE